MMKFKMGESAIITGTKGEYDGTTCKICGVASQHPEFSFYIVELPYVAVGGATHIQLVDSCLIRIPEIDENRRRFYLYTNSPASAKDGQVGFVIGYPVGTEYLTENKKLVTTREFGFAWEFKSFSDALCFNDALPHQCIIFERRDL